MSLTRVAVYRRRIAASIERVRENVLDWEHLPWLHAGSFGHVRLLEGRRDGFRAETSMRGAAFEIDVAFESDGLEYHSRTLTGRGAGSDVVTRLSPEGSETEIEVEFLVPDMPADGAERIGARYLALYARLWDEDEAMMIRRQAFLDGALVREFREVCVDGVRFRHASVCPHLGGPLESAPDADGCITCPWHGYRFDLRTGRSADGRGLRLRTSRVDRA